VAAALVLLSKECVNDEPLGCATDEIEAIAQCIAKTFFPSSRYVFPSLSGDSTAFPRKHSDGPASGKL